MWVGVLHCRIGIIVWAACTLLVNVSFDLSVRMTLTYLLDSTNEGERSEKEEADKTQQQQ